MFYFLKRFALFFLLPLIFLLVLFAYYKKSEIKSYTVNYLVNTIEQQTDCKVKLKNIKFSFPINISIDQIDLHKDETCIASFNQFRISLRPWELWNEGIVIHEIRIKEAMLYECLTDASASSVEWTLPDAAIAFKSIHIDKFVIDKKLVPLNVQTAFENPLNLSGSFIFDPFQKEISIDVSASQIDKDNSLTKIAVTFSKLHEKVHAQMRVFESENGLLSSLYPTPKGYQWNLFSDVWSTVAVLEDALRGKVPPEMPELFQGEFQLNYLNNFPALEGQDLLSDAGFFEGVFKGSDHGINITNFSGIVGKFNLQGAIAFSYDMDLTGSKLSLEIDNYTFNDKEIGFIQPFVTCAIVGKLPNPTIHMNVICHEIELEKYKLRNVNAESSFHYLDNAVNGNLFIKGEYLETPCSLRTNFLMKDLLKLSNCELSFGNAQMKGEMNIEIPSMLCEGEIQGQCSLLEMEKFDVRDVNGSVSFHAYLNAIENKQNLSIDLLASDFQFRNCFANHVEASATLSDLMHMDLNHHKILLQVSCKNAKYDRWNLENIELKTCTDSSSLDWPFSVECTIDNQLQLFAKGNWDATLDNLRLSMDSFIGTFDKYQFALKNPFNIEFSHHEIKFTPLAIGIANGVVKAYGNFNDEEIYLSLEASQIPLELGNAFNKDMPIDGSLNCNIELVQRNGMTKGLAKIHVKGIDALEEKLGVSLPLEAELDARIADDFCLCRGLISGLSPQPVPIALDIPIAINLFPIHFEVKNNLPVKGNLSFDGAIEPILELFIPANGPNISGKVDLAINLSGTLENPKIHGEANIYNGSFDILDMGLSFREIQGHIALSGKQATLVSLSGTDGIQGKVTAKGTVNLEPSKNYPFDVGILIEHAVLRPSDYAWATANGNFTLSGNKDEVTINGNITSDEVHIQIPEQIPELLQSVQVTYINQPEHVSPPTVYKKKLSEKPLNLNLSLDIPQKGYVNGSSWTSEWNGNVTVTGTTDAPQLHGGCRLLKGDLRLQGKPFELREGTITFAGDPEKKTSLYVIASEDLDEITAEIILKGSLRNPAISFRSNPPLPQREILSWILFNRGTSDITSFQGTQLNDSITNLNMNDGKPDILTRLRTGFGFDRLDISRDNNNPNEVSVQVGKYISRGILVSVNKSVTAESNQVALEADVAKNVKVKAQVGDDSEGQLQLKWKKDY